MARVIDADGLASAAAIRNETEDEANTAIRLGDHLKDIWDSKANLDVTDGLQTQVNNLGVSKEPVTTANSYADVSGSINFPNPYQKSYYASFENMEGNATVVLPNALPSEAAYIQIRVNSCDNRTLRFQSLHGSISFKIPDAFKEVLPVTAVAANEFTCQLPNNTTDIVIIAMSYQDGSWFMNAGIYKTPTVS